MSTYKLFGLAGFDPADHPKNLNQVNKHLRELGIPVKAVSGGSYYYFLDEDDNPIDGASVYTYRASSQAFSDWESDARAAAARVGKGFFDGLTGSLAAFGSAEDESDEWDALSARQRSAFDTARRFNEAQRERRDFQRQLRALEEREAYAWYRAGGKPPVPSSPERRRLAAAYRAASKREESLVGEFMRQYRRVPPGWARTREPGMDENEGTLDGLPKRGRIPLATAKRALKKLGRKAKACRIDPAALREGMEIEREHRDVTGGRVGMTAKIAASHLCEDPRYYKKLKKYVER